MLFTAASPACFASDTVEQQMFNEDEAFAQDMAQVQEDIDRQETETPDDAELTVEQRQGILAQVKLTSHVIH